jgi:hypothetical protein
MYTYDTCTDAAYGAACALEARRYRDAIGYAATALALCRPGNVNDAAAARHARAYARLARCALRRNGGAL